TPLGNDFSRRMGQHPQLDISMPRLFTVLLFLLPGFPLDAAEALHGEVVAIADGDTLTLLTADETQHRIRLDQIDTPERGQPFGTRARQALADRAFRRHVEVRVRELDRYGRVVGEVFVAGESVNRALVRDGFAWAYRHYLKDREYLELEQEAREARRGLWVDADPVPPWDWRRGVRGNREENREGAFECAPLKRCAEMRSCEEALFQLRECGASRIDGDGD